MVVLRLPEACLASAIVAPNDSLYSFDFEISIGSNDAIIIGQQANEPAELLCADSNVIEFKDLSLFECLEKFLALENPAPLAPFAPWAFHYSFVFHLYPLI
ncbi:hypothetical protein ES703_105627 [subsurface metagenome]